MLLRASSETTGTEVDMAAVNGILGGDAGIAHAAELVAFTEAVMRDDDASLERARAELGAVLSPAELVDTCAVIAAFNVVDRIADSTGIPLDDMVAAITEELRADLNLGRFRSSANTPSNAR